MGAEELVGQLHENAGAVAGVDLAAARAAVVQVFEGREAVAHDFVRAHALEVDEIRGVVILKAISGDDDYEDDGPDDDDEDECGDICALPENAPDIKEPTVKEA